MQSLQRSLVITFLSTNSGLVIQFVVVLILSRILSPSEVGIFSITSVFIGIASILRDFGVSAYLQREKDLTREKMRSALGLLLTTSWLLAGLLFLSSDHVAQFYRQPGIASVMRVLSISFALVPFASYLYAILARNMRSDKQAIVNVVSNLVYAVVCISLATMGYSYMALAWANVANICVSIALFVMMRPPQTPFMPSFSGWRAPMRFGSGAILGNLINQANNSIPDLILGKLSGPHNVGLYSRANGLVGMFQQIAGPTINYHAVPYIAGHHHASEPLGPMLSKAASYLTGLAWPAFIFTAAFAADIIRLLYGATWVEAAPIVVFLCIQAAGRIGFSLCEPGLLAIGKPYYSAISAVANLAIRLLVISLVGADDVVMFAAAICVADLLTLPIPAYLMARHLAYPISAAAQAFLGSLKVAGICLVAVLAARALLPEDWPGIVRLLIGGLTLAFAWLAGVTAARHPLLAEFPAILKIVLPRALAERVEKLLPRQS